MRYSIIVPVYNAEDALKRCVNSILEQTVSDFELILIDDGSTDNSGIICDSYKGIDSRIRVLHQKNQGVSSARNYGLNLATGDYILFIDSDDYINKTFLELFEERTDDLLITGYQHEGYKLNPPVVHEYKDDFYTSKSERSLLNSFSKNELDFVWAKCFLRRIIRDNNLEFDASLSFAEDTLFVLQYIKFCNSIRLIEGDEYHYVRYQRETLSTMNYLSIDALRKIETANDKIYCALCDIIKSKNTKQVMITRMGIAYRSIMIELESQNKYSYRFLWFLFKQKWFRETLKNADRIYPDESPKYRFILKLKSAFFYWLYLKIRRVL